MEFSKLILNIRQGPELQLRRTYSGSGDSKKDSKDKLVQGCAKRKPVKKLSIHDESYVHQEIIKDLKKRKGVNKRKCGKTPEELRKCLKTLQDVVDCVHPVVPYVSSDFLKFIKELHLSSFCISIFD